jgi:predicted RNase H-like HicB family nuclease
MHYPLLFTYRGSVIGKGFLAEISARGRVLASVESDGCWLYGVNPGGVAVDGSSLEDAHRELRETIRLVLVDLANEATTFDAFQLSIEEFFKTTNEPTREEWETAVAQVRAMKVTVEGLPSEPAASDLFVRVTMKSEHEFSARDNVVESHQALATAA